MPHEVGFQLNKTVPSNLDHEFISQIDERTSQLSHELLLLKTNHSGFISRDKISLLTEQGISGEELQKIAKNRNRLLGGFNIVAIASAAATILQSVINTIKSTSDDQELRSVFNRNIAKDMLCMLSAEHAENDLFFISYISRNGNCTFEDHLEGVEWHREAIVGKATFQLKIFKGGYIIKKGDGGDLNWILTGNPSSRELTRSGHRAFCDMGHCVNQKYTESLGFEYRWS